MWAQRGYLWVQGGYLGGWVTWIYQVGGQDRWVGRSGGWVVGQVGMQFRWVRQVGKVGLIGCGLEGSKFRTVSE